MQLPLPTSAVKKVGLPAPDTLGIPADVAPAARGLPWRYDASQKRDLRIDFFRGLAILVMVTNHLQASSYLNAVVQGRIYATAAEAFVLLSGLVLGMISRGRVTRDGAASANRKLGARALTLYKTYLVLVGVAVGITFVHPGAAVPLLGGLPDTLWKTAIAAPLLYLSPGIIDVLQLYVLCLAGSPVLLWLLERRCTAAVLLGSVGLWTIHQLHPYALSGSPLGREHPYFALPAWQLLYVGGFVFGFHREVARRWLARVPRWGLFAFALPVVGAAIVANYYDVTRGVWPVGVVARARWIALVDRSSLGALRVVTVVALFTLLFVIVDACWRPIARVAGPAFITLGQSSLYVYVMHVPLVVGWHALGLPHESVITTTAGQLFVLALLWLMVKTRFLYNVVPH